MKSESINATAAGTENMTQPKQAIILTIGIFFDGTGQNSSDGGYHQVNYTDTRNRMRELSSDQHLLPAHGFIGRAAVSSLNAQTNIYKLYTLYRQDIAPDSGSGQYALYIEGVGTEDGAHDNIYGIVTGRGDTGVVKKTDKAVAALAGCIRDYLGRLDVTHHCIIQNIQFDIFGFSRGAAAARHFANRVFSQDPAIIAALQPVLTKRVSQGALEVKTRFLGLFDTVAAICTPINGLNPHNADTGEVNLKLRPGVAQKVFHITAQHECRFNFALNSVKPAWPELALPGVHSDIGGGYNTCEYERYFVTRPEYETVPLSTPDSGTRIYQKTCEQLSAMAAYPAIAPLLQTAGVTVESWHDARMPADRYGARQKRSGAAAVIERPTYNDWSKVVLRVMVDAAQDAGVEFYPCDSAVPGIAFQSELQRFCEKAILMGRAIRTGLQVDGFTDEEIHRLAEKYIHCSANWNCVEKDDQGRLRGAVRPAKWINFINRPDERWRRAVYDMDGKKVQI
ncbi:MULTISPECIES: T6SS phospholipase effector Tle1-like catalytic domain-containing protein [Tenebrionibacter/Tenebrionicola group]|jgi:hypothetical protein|uniref:DUF2235 domain-containing protein n=2 Tax=Tenebrionibacter/Tenebrionicola group TaxID=2969848 RepID=A0A8K0V293_9ENTR|nr:MULTISPECIES: DUF2235 domain-containing protein [Tenebrionibacter/Tenebrionicola group]MBK4715673.1 DUF2235 domain-containing protein [Tenebrionibacter intestinalis]MBV5096426.1 DUF2235 domain-containing protein [Tenebrionicola larvae]